MAETADIARFEYTENEFVVTPRCNFFQADLDLLERPLLDELPRRENEWLTFIMNFEFCQKIDADGILFILRLYDLLQAKDHEFIIINCNDRIMRSLKLFRLDKSFPIGINKSSKELAEEAAKRDRLQEERDSLRRARNRR